MTQGGFDVVIGNPPYVEYSKILKGTEEQAPYSVRGYATENCGNLYAFTWERCKFTLALEKRESEHDCSVEWATATDAICKN